MALPPTHPFRLASALAAALALILVRPAASGQTVPAPPAAASDETVQLSPFDVTGESGTGYATSSVLTVSRVATPVTEVPVSAEVINQQMIQDTMAVTAADTFNLISGLYIGNAGAGNQESNVFSLRGYTQSSTERDGVDDSLFNSAGGFDYSFIQAIEVIKGPNGVLYANSSPGGVVNIISKRPTEQPFTTFSLTDGSFGFYRGELDTSQFLDKDHEWGIRIAGAFSDTYGPVHWEGDPKLGYRGINPSLSFKSKTGFEVWLWTAVIRDSSSRAEYMTRAFATSPPASTSVAGATGGLLLSDREFIDGGAANNLLHAYSQLNTNSYELGTSKSFELGPLSIDTRALARYSMQLNDPSRVRAIGNDYFLNAQGQMIGPSTAIDNRFIQLSQVSDAGTIASEYRTGLEYEDYNDYIDSTSFDLDLNITYQLPWLRLQTLLNGLASQGKNYNAEQVYEVTTVATLASLGYPVVNGVARVYLYSKPLVNFGITRETVMNQANIHTLTGSTITDGDLHRYGFLERLSFWDTRVVVVGGASKNINDNRVESSTATGGWSAAAVDVDRQWTPGFGALVKAYHGEMGDLVGFANLNRTFTPIYSVDQRLASYGQKFPDEDTQANEYGVKADLFQSRVVLTSSYFDTKENNVLLSYVDDANGTVTGIPDKTYSGPGGTQISRGFEEDLNVKVTQSLEAIISYGKIHSVLAATGLPQEAVPLNTASALATYRFQSGWAKGLTLTYIYTHWGDSYLGGGARTKWEIPGGDRHTAVLGYHWKNYVVRLRVENLFDVRNALPSSFDTGVGITLPRNYRLGFTAKF